MTKSTYDTYIKTKHIIILYTRKYTQTTFVTQTAL